MLAGLWVLAAVPGAAQVRDEQSCVYDRQLYPEGAELCQGGTLERCEDGAWADVGLCPDGAQPPPRSAGGDEGVERGSDLPRQGAEGSPPATR